MIYKIQLELKTTGNLKGQEWKEDDDEDDEVEGQALEEYILSATCAMTRHTSLEINEDRSYETIKLAILRIFYERGTCRVMISDMEVAVRDIEKDVSEKDFKDTREMIEGWKVFEQKLDLEIPYKLNLYSNAPKALNTWDLLKECIGP